MKVFMNIPKYTLFLIGLYLLIFPLSLIYKPEVLNFDASKVNLGYVLVIFIITLLIFFLLNLKYKVRRIGWQKPSLLQVLLTLIYSALFAIPEEIIFRGVIQGALQDSLSNTFLIVGVSSAIFGLAHLPNGAKGLRIQDWNWKFCAITFIAGVPLGWSFIGTGSLFIPVLLHALFLILYKLFTADYHTVLTSYRSGI